MPSPSDLTAIDGQGPGPVLVDPGTPRLAIAGHDRTDRAAGSGIPDPCLVPPPFLVFGNGEKAALVPAHGHPDGSGLLQNRPREVEGYQLQRLQVPQLDTVDVPLAEDREQARLPSE